MKSSRHHVETRGALRLAVAMRGGVSLAVWIGGALREIDRLHRPQGDDDFVEKLFDLTVFTRAEIDILTGASAGGLNAALGGYAIAENRPMDDLKDVWIQTADIDRLLESPTPSPRRSILDGDYFLHQIEERICRLATPREPGEDSTPVEMFLATTVFGGLQVSERVDQLFSDRRSEGVFHFRHLGDSPAFSDLMGDEAPKRVAAGARATASFPGAFEPVIARKGEFIGELLLPPTGIDPYPVRLLDGGVVDNIPVERAIQAAAAAPAIDPVRRWIVFLHPSPDELGKRPPMPGPGDVPSIPAVGKDLLAGLHAETLLDDLEYLEVHNRDVEMYQVQQYSLCKLALDRLTEADLEHGLGSVDAYCLYALLDNPVSMLAWIPIGEPPPPSPIPGMSDHTRFSLRMNFLDLLVERSGSIRPFARLVRLAHLMIDWIRWAEQHVAGQFAPQRQLVYDVLLLAKLLDATAARAVLEAHGDYLEQLGDALQTIENLPALQELIAALTQTDPGTSGDVSAMEPAGRAKPLCERLAGSNAEVLENLACGRILEGEQAGVQRPQGLSEKMLDHLVGVCGSILRRTGEGSDTQGHKSVFELLGTALENDASPSQIRLCLLTVDQATAGMHRGRPIGTPQSLNYLRIAGSATSPLAESDLIDDDPVPRFRKIQVTNGHIDPDSKLAGNKLANFSGFVSSRFRANDWMWGRMDAATEMVNLLVRPEYLKTATIEHLTNGIESLLKSPFGAALAPIDSLLGAAETVCAAAWDKHKAEVQAELRNLRETDPRSLPVTRRLIQTRWHLEILVNEMPTVLDEPIEPGLRPKAKVPRQATSDRDDSPSGIAKQRLSTLIDRYESEPRQVSALWGRRRTTALGVRVARQTSRALVPDAGRFAACKRVGLAAPFMIVAAALLSRGAFLVAWNALVGLVFVPRLALTARVTLGFSSLLLSFLFWLRFVRRSQGAWRGWLSGMVALMLSVAWVPGTWLADWPVRAPAHFRDPLPWSSRLDSSVVWPAVVVAGASALATWCLWVWAKPWLIVVASATVGTLMGGSAILGAWIRPTKAGVLQRIVAGLGSMWIQAVFLALVCTWFAVRHHPEDRPPPAGENPKSR